MKYRFSFLIISLAFFISSANITSAQFSTGGMIVFTHECLCSGGWMMYIYDVGKMSVVPIVYQFGISRLNSNFNFFTPGVSVVGSNITGGICIMASFSCYGGYTPIGTVGPYGTPGMGTSLF